MMVEGEVEVTRQVAEAWQRADKVQRWETTGNITTIYFNRAYRISPEDWPVVVNQFHSDAQDLLKSTKKRR